MRTIRVVALALVGLGLVLWHWGPTWRDETRPLTVLAAEAGGEYRMVALGPGDSLQVVSHDIDKYCFSPGRGAIVEWAAPTPERAMRAAIAIRDALGAQAVVEGRPNFTVTFERPVGRRWPWAARSQMSVTFHHGGSPDAWRVTTASPELFRAARAYADSVRRTSSPVI